MENTKILLCFCAGLTILGCSEDSKPVNVEERSLLEVSRAAWNAQKDMFGESYNYETRFASVFGFSSITTQYISSGTVIRRVYETTDQNDVQSSIYDEGASEVGTNSAGAEPATIDELYDVCESILKTKNPSENFISFDLDDDNVLKKCTFFPKNCADDCDEGVNIQNINFNA